MVRRLATACYERSRALRHEDGDRYSEAATLSRLGDTHLAR
jgi:hypothetical protein